MQTDRHNLLFLRTAYCRRNAKVVAGAFCVANLGGGCAVGPASISYPYELYTKTSFVFLKTNS